MRGTPVYTPYNRIETIIDGQSREVVQDWNVTANMLVNSTFDVAQKYGAPSYGWRSDNDNVQNLETLDGRHCEQNEPGSFSGPLINNILSNCQKYVPILAMGTGNKIHLTIIEKLY